MILSLDGNHLVFEVLRKQKPRRSRARRNARRKTLLCTANPGKVFALGPEYERRRIRSSRNRSTLDFFRGGDASNGGRKIPREGRGTSSRAEFYARGKHLQSGFENWSAWAGPYMSSGQRSKFPPARYAQWKVVLHSGSGSPLSHWVSLSYLPKNLPPQIEDVVLQDPNVRVQGMPVGGIVIGYRQGAMRVCACRKPGARIKLEFRFRRGVQTEIRSHSTRRRRQARKRLISPCCGSRRMITTTTSFTRSTIAAKTKKQWKLLKDNLHDTFYSWDTSSMADGGYYLKIVASDSPSNPPADALETDAKANDFRWTTHRLSVIGPRGQAERGGARIRVARRIPAATSRALNTSVDAGDWKLVEPKAA